METICIPRKRYEYLIKCERLVDMEFEEYIEVKNILGEREKLFESL